MKDFFISYNSKDRDWAEWIAYQLEEAGYSTIIQAWDFRPGGNFVLEMQHATRSTACTIVVLSQNYLDALYTQPEWATAFVQDPTGGKRKLIPVRVSDCQIEGLLLSIIYIDLIGKDERKGIEELLKGVSMERTKPRGPIVFPSKLQSASITSESKPEFPSAPSIPSIIPYTRTPFFTGREEILRRLHESLIATGMVALSGLGGIGKTHIAIEYAYRHSADYEKLLWSKADTREALLSGFVVLAAFLDLPEHKNQDQSLAVMAVRRWLEANSGWLLVLDNADDLTLIREFIPSEGQGHMLVTTRSQATGRIARILIEEMEPESGALFLLRRAKIIAESARLDAASGLDCAKAKDISKELGGLPLALDQAGAYIEETGCSLSDYLTLYQSQGAKLRNYRDILGSDYPYSVATTWKLSFEKLEKVKLASVELLRFCAFLHPDAIPEEVISSISAEISPVLGEVAADPFELNVIIAEILKYSLLKRVAVTKTLNIHRLVQRVIQDSMDEVTQILWAQRVVRVLNHVFPNVEVLTWSLCERLLLQAQSCADLIDNRKIELPEAARLLDQTGCYLLDRGRYAEAAPLLKRALVIREKVLSPEHPDVASTLNNLAGIYDVQAQYAEAETFYEKALAIREKTLGIEHPDVADTLGDLGRLYRVQRQFDKSELLLTRALVIQEKALGSGHPKLAKTLMSLGILYSEQKLNSKVESLYQRALSIREQALGVEHPDVAESLNNLGAFYLSQMQYAEAEPLLKRALAIREKSLGPEHPVLAYTLSNLASIYINQEQYIEAEPLLKRALAIRERSLGSEHPVLVNTLSNLASIYINQEQYIEAEPLLKRALAIGEKSLGPEHPSLAYTLNNLGFVCLEQGQYTEAESLFRHSLKISEKSLGSSSYLLATVLQNLGKLYYVQSAYAEAEPFYQRSLAIWEEAKWPQEQNAAKTLENYALLLQKTGREVTAVSCEAHAQTIRAGIFNSHMQNSTTK